MTSPEPRLPRSESRVPARVRAAIQRTLARALECSDRSPAHRIEHLHRAPATLPHFLPSLVALVHGVTYDAAVNVLQLVEQDFRQRVARNPRYSLRAYGRRLGIDHSTLSQWLRGERPITPRTIEQIGWRLGFTPRELRSAFADEQLDATSRRILVLAVSGPCNMDTPSLARRLGVSCDAINIALQRLLRRGLLQMDADGRWRSQS